MNSAPVPGQHRAAANLRRYSANWRRAAPSPSSRMPTTARTSSAVHRTSAATAPEERDRPAELAIVIPSRGPRDGRCLRQCQSSAPALLVFRLESLDIRRRTARVKEGPTHGVSYAEMMISLPGEEISSILAKGAFQVANDTAASEDGAGVPRSIALDSRNCIAVAAVCTWRLTPAGECDVGGGGREELLPSGRLEPNNFLPLRPPCVLR